MPTNPPRAPGELADEVEAIIRRHVWARVNGDAVQILGFGAAAAEIASLRSATGDGGEAMRSAAAACAAGWRTPALKHTGLDEVEQDIARRTAAGIEAAILDLPQPRSTKIEGADEL